MMCVSGYLVCVRALCSFSFSFFFFSFFFLKLGDIIDVYHFVYIANYAHTYPHFQTRLYLQINQQATNIFSCGIIPLRSNATQTVRLSAENMPEAMTQQTVFIESVELYPKHLEAFVIDTMTRRLYISEHVFFLLILLFRSTNISPINFSLLFLFLIFFYFFLFSLFT